MKMELRHSSPQSSQANANWVTQPISPEGKHTCAAFGIHTVGHPSPLPQGVESAALGAEVPSTPEPATWGAVAVALSVLAMLATRRRRARAHHFTS